MASGKHKLQRGLSYPQTPIHTPQWIGPPGPQDLVQVEPCEHQPVALSPMSGPLADKVEDNYWDTVLPVYDVDEVCLPVHPLFYLYGKQFLLTKKYIIQLYNHSTMFRMHCANGIILGRRTVEFHIPSEICENVECFYILCGLAIAKFRACQMYLPHFLYLCNYFMVNESYIHSRRCQIL